MKIIGARLVAVSAILLMSIHRLSAPIIEEEATPQPSVATKRKAEAKSAKTAPAETGMSSRSVQVVLTPKTQAALAELRSYVQKANSAPFGISTDVQPDEIVEKLRLTLSNRFNNVSISNNESRNGLTMLFDLQVHVASFSGTKNTVSIVGTFKTASGRTLQTISASGTSSMPYPAFATRFPQAVSAAFTDFSQKLAAAR